ncbi:unnamed protein product, partial [Ectocarpus sp. 12 AP-2014]
PHFPSGRHRATAMPKLFMQASFVLAGRRKLYAFSRVMLRQETCHLARREEACMCVVAPTVAVDVREPICRIIPRMMFLILVTTPIRQTTNPLSPNKRPLVRPLWCSPCFSPAAFIV